MQDRIRRTIELARTNINSAHMQGSAQFAVDQADHFFSSGDLANAANMAYTALSHEFGAGSILVQEALELVREVRRNESERISCLHPEGACDSCGPTCPYAS